MQRKEEKEEKEGTGGRRKKEEKEVRMVEEEGRSTRMTGDDGRSTRVSSPLRESSPPCTCAPEPEMVPGTSGSGRRSKRGEGEEGRSRSKGRKEDKDKDKDWQELLEQSYLLPAPGATLQQIHFCDLVHPGEKQGRGQLTSMSSMGDEERREWRGAVVDQEKQEPREVGQREDLLEIILLFKPLSL